MKWQGSHFIICLSFGSAILLSSKALAQASDEERLSGFAQHNRGNKVFDKERESTKGEIAKARKAWELQQQNSVDEYRRAKAKQAKTVDETSPEYKIDQAARKKTVAEQEKREKEFVKERNRQRALKNSHITLTEEQEYDLQSNTDRVPLKKRAIYGGKDLTSDKAKFGGAASPMNNSGADFSPGGPSDYVPPPPSGPDFFEPEIPPPPPPPAMDTAPQFDESVPAPPPIFDDPDF